MAGDIIPSNDGDFDIFQKQFIGGVAANPAKYGLTGDEATALQASQGKWGAAYPLHLKAQADAITATQVKETERGNLEALLRSAARKVNGVVGVDNVVRATLGLPAREETRSSIGAPTTRPIGRTESSGHLTLIAHFADETTPQKLAKPAGVQGCQLFFHVGDPQPADASGYAFLALDTRTPYVHEHAAADAGKTVHYLFRWQNAKGETGPWSDVVIAKIPL